MYITYIKYISNWIFIYNLYYLGLEGRYSIKGRLKNIRKLSSSEDIALVHGHVSVPAVNLLPHHEELRIQMNTLPRFWTVVLPITFCVRQVKYAPTHDRQANC